MKTSTIALALLPMLAMTACGSDPAPGPTEQIVVRDPGEAPAPQPAVAEADAGASETSDGEAELLALGQRVYGSCAGCHSLEKDGPGMAGPNLYGIVGKAAASVEGYPYSDALKASGITWTEAELDAYIADPAGKVPGTTMVAGAIGDPARREAVIAFIKDQSAD